MWFEHDVEFSGKSIEQIIHKIDIFFVYACDRDQPTRKSIVRILIVLRTIPPSLKKIKCAPSFRIYFCVYFVSGYEEICVSAAVTIYIEFNFRLGELRDLNLQTPSIQI